MAIPTSGTQVFYTVYEHLLYNAPILNASPRLTQDFSENLYGHRSGNQTPISASSGGTVPNGGATPVGTNGLQTAGQALTPSSWPAPNNTVALPRIQAGASEQYQEQINFRLNPESA